MRVSFSPHMNIINGYYEVHISTKQTNKQANHNQTVIYSLFTS